MRNFSMKKFGTPGSAGPGVATERVGSLGVGVPSGLRAGGAAGVAVAAGRRSSPERTWALPRRFPRARCCCAAPPPPSAGAVGTAVGVAVAAGVCVGSAVGAGVSVGVGVAVVVVTGVGTGVATGPRSSTSWTSAGRPVKATWSTGVPGGTSTARVSC